MQLLLLTTSHVHYTRLGRCLLVIVANNSRNETSSSPARSSTVCDLAICRQAQLAPTQITCTNSPSVVCSFSAVGWAKGRASGFRHPGVNPKKQFFLGGGGGPGLNLLKKQQKNTPNLIQFHFVMPVIIKDFFMFTASNDQ